MNKIPDKIAAFAPISGYPMGGTTANASVRPIPIIHTHGTGDDVVNFGGVQGALNAWIKHNGCPTTAKVEKNYRGTPHITRHTWGPGNDGVEVVLMELADKGHWISNDYGVKTGEEIWKFCKRYSLQMKDPYVRITAPQEGLKYVTIGGASQIPAITLKATASDPDGQVVKVDFYDGKTLVGTLDKAPFNYTFESLAKGDHQLRVVATDDEGRTGQSQVTVSIQEPTTNYVYSQVFTVEGSVPEGWETYDGNERRVGFASGFTSGCRVFHFTGTPHDFEWGLYARNVNGKAREGYARFAGKQTPTTLMLYPGNYMLYHRLANWNIESFSPVTIAIETIDGKSIYEETVTPQANIGNTASNPFSGTKTGNFNFDVTEFGRYQITFYTADAAWADLVVGQTALRRVGDLSGISAPLTDHQECAVKDAVYDLQGRRVSARTIKKGLYIINGRKVLVQEP